MKVTGPCIAMKPAYSVGEVAALTGFSRTTSTRLFESERGESYSTHHFLQWFSGIRALLALRFSTECHPAPTAAYAKSVGKIKQPKPINNYFQARAKSTSKMSC